MSPPERAIGRDVRDRQKNPNQDTWMDNEVGISDVNIVYEQFRCILQLVVR